MGPISYQWENGAWQPVAGIPLTDRGFRHGISVFETIGIVGGKLFFLKEHLAKLRQAAARTGLRALPESLAFTDLALPGCGVARIYITGGDGSLRSPFSQGRIFFFTEERVSTTPEPLRLRMHPEPVSLPLAGLKTGNYWLQIQALQDAIAAGCDEAVLINRNDHVISAATANLFAVHEGMLITPRTASGARAGVIRDWVLQNAEVVVCDFHAAQLLEASEIFLTSSGLGIVPVARLDNRELKDRTVCSLLKKAFSA